MIKLRDRPIQQKLLFITMVTTAVSLLAAGLSIVAADSTLFRGYLRRDLEALARIVADNCTGALAFDDPESAAQTLGALRARPHVTGACVYRVNGRVFARYSRDRSFNCPPVGTGLAVPALSGFMTMSEPVVLKSRRIGMLMLRYDLGEIKQRILLYGSTVLGVLIGSMALAFFLSSRLRDIVAAPIRGLVMATTSVAETGDYGIRAEKVTGDELGLLVDRFNEMLAGIQRRENDLKQALTDRESALREVERERERFHFTAESMPQKIFTATPAGEVNYFNGQWMEFTGLSFERIRSRGWWPQFVHPDDLDANVQSWRQSVETGRPFHFEHRFRQADGQYRWHLTRALPMLGRGGEIVMWIGSNTDIHEQKEKEQELRRANEDLQQFAYSASHDLQEPIRNVAVYSEIVAARYAGVLDDDGKQFLGFIREGGRRMATLVDDLLAYTRASMMEFTESPVDSLSALKNSLAGLSEAIREADAIVTYDALPEVYMGEVHLQQVFQNLVSNALKYRTEERPSIHISAQAQGAFWRFSVSDNGIGIDPRYKEKIFGLFKRLHHDSKYAGTGIGLAICQRVLQRYGGKIWVESEPDRGATFYFTVPGSDRGTGPAVEPAAG